MSSPASTPRGRKRGRNTNPSTRRLNEMSSGVEMSCGFMLWVSWAPLWSALYCESSASSQDPTSPPYQRRRGQDSSTGDLMPMPTSPVTDMLSPAAPQDTSLFSSPRPSGTSRFRLPVIYKTIKIKNVNLLLCDWRSSAKWSGHEFSFDVRNPQLQGGRDPSQWRAWHPSPPATRSGVS